MRRPHASDDPSYLGHATLETAEGIISFPVFDDEQKNAIAIPAKAYKAKGGELVFVPKEKLVDGKTAKDSKVVLTKEDKDLAKTIFTKK